MADDKEINTYTLTIKFGVDNPEYWQALGNFIEDFAVVESLLLMFMEHCVKINHDLSNAVFSGIRVQTMMDNIRRIWKIEKPTPESIKEIEEAFTHFKWILDARNTMVHFYSVLDEEKGHIVSNAQRALTPEAIKEIRISPTTISDMRSDLKKIGSCFMKAAFLSTIPDKSKEKIMWNDRALQNAWQYTPPQVLQRSSKKPKRSDR